MRWIWIHKKREKLSFRSIGEHGFKFLFYAEFLFPGPWNFHLSALFFDLVYGNTAVCNRVNNSHRTQAHSYRSEHLGAFQLNGGAPELCMLDLFLTLVKSLFSMTQPHLDAGWNNEVKTDDWSRLGRVKYNFLLVVWQKQSCPQKTRKIVIRLPLVRRTLKILLRRSRNLTEGTPCSSEKVTGSDDKILGRQSRSFV